VLRGWVNREGNPFGKQWHSWDKALRFSIFLNSAQVFFAATERETSGAN
jgi:hypothetical protein